MPRNKLVDRGEEIITVYPEVLFIDRQGNRSYRAGREGHAVRISVSEERKTPSDMIGQVSISLVRCVARSIPAWDWARVVFRGEEWDIVTPPHISSGASRATRHHEFVLRSRNGLDNMVGGDELG